MGFLVSDSGRGAVAQLDAWGADQVTWLGPEEPWAPAGLAGLPGGGGVVVTDRATHRIAAWDGISWSFFGELGSGIGQFDRPRGIAVDGGGRIYVADTANARVVRLDDLDGSGWVAYGQRASSAAELAEAGRFVEPTGIAVGADGHLHVADPLAGRVVSMSDIGGGGWSARPLGGPVALTARADGTLGIALLGDAAVVVIDDVGPPQATPAGTLAAPLAVAALGAQIVCCDGMGQRLVRLGSTFGGLKAIDEWRLEGIGIRRPVGLAVVEEGP